MERVPPVVDVPERVGDRRVLSSPCRAPMQRIGFKMTNDEGTIFEYKCGRCGRTRRRTVS